MNLKDFKEWLNQFPDDTIVETVDIIFEHDAPILSICKFDPLTNSVYYPKQNTLQIGDY